MLVEPPSGHSKIRCVKSQYSSSDSPLNANTAKPAAAIAAAAWSWVEKMLHEAQRTSAPRALRVSISTAVWIVMCSEPEMRAPLSGFLAANSSRIAIRPGISVSAIRISLRPQSASLRSATLKSPAVVRASTVVDIGSAPSVPGAPQSRKAPETGPSVYERRCLR